MFGLDPNSHITRNEIIEAPADRADDGGDISLDAQIDATGVGSLNSVKPKPSCQSGPYTTILPTDPEL